MIERPCSPARAFRPWHDLLGEMTAAWARGERPLAEDFLARHPRLRGPSGGRRRPDLRGSLPSRAVRRKREPGGPACGRFPQWRAQLEVLLDCQRLFESEGAGAVSRRPASRTASFACWRSWARRRRRSCLPGRAALAGRPAGRLETHAAHRPRAPSAGPLAAHAHRPALLRPGRSGAQVSAPCACPTLAGPACRAFWLSWSSAPPTADGKGPARRSRPSCKSSPCSIAVDSVRGSARQLLERASLCPGDLLDRHLSGERPALRRTSTAWCIWT